MKLKRAAFSVLGVLAVAAGLVLMTRCQMIHVHPSQQLTTYDIEPWRAVLATHIDDGLVDYAGLRQHHEIELDRFLDAVGRFGPKTTPSQFRGESEALAYHLNAYNAIMLRKWLDAGAGRAGFDRSTQVNRTWFFFQLWKVDGRWISLNDLEQEVIRPTYGDERIHLALVCGAMSCPPLLEEPFEGGVLDGQLAGLGRRWLAEPDGLELDADGTAALSSIFQWYAADFDAAGGMASVLETYLAAENPRREALIEAVRAGRVRFMDYDWTINQSPQDEGSPP